MKANTSFNYDKKSILKQLSTVLPSYVLNTVASVLLAFLFARWMSLSQFGAYAFSYHSIRLAALFAGIGLNMAAVKFIPGYHKNGEKGFATGFFRLGVMVHVVLGVIVGSVFFKLALPIIEGTNSHYAMQHSWWIATLLGLSLFFSGILRSYGAGAFSVATQGYLRDFLAVLIAFLFLTAMSDFNAEQALLAIAGAIFICILIQTIFFWFRNPWKKKEFITPRYEIKKWMSTSRSMFVIAATQLLYSTADIIILRLVIGEKIAGIYHVAVTLSILVTIPAKAILTIVARHIARLSSDKEQALKERLIQISLRLLILPTLFLSVCLILFGKKILLLFGSGYVVAYDIMVLLVFAQFISSFETFNGAVLNY